MSCRCDLSQGYTSFLTHLSCENSTLVGDMSHEVDEPQHLALGCLEELRVTLPVTALIRWPPHETSACSDGGVFPCDSFSGVWDA